MFRTGTGFAGLLAAGMLAASLGCAEMAGQDEPADPLTSHKQAVAKEREQVLRTHHERVVEEFVKTEGFGFSRMPMLTHRMKPGSLALSLPGLPEGATLTATGELPLAEQSPWMMEKVELIGLLNDKKPVAYPAEKMGRVFGRPPGRDLDNFELETLGRLREGEAVTVAEAPGHVRMVGAIRARQACKACHDKPEGTLLGAFSYVFSQGAPKAAK